MPVTETLKGVANIIENSLIEKHTTPAAIMSRFVGQTSFYIDPQVKGLVGSLGRSASRTFKFCKALRLRVGSNAAREQSHRRTRYWLATRQSMATGTAWATSLDAKGFSGKDWQCGPICNVGTRKFAWMPPVVPVDMRL